MRLAAVAVLPLMLVTVAAGGCGRDAASEPRQAVLVYAEAAAFSGFAKTISVARANGGQAVPLVQGDSPQISPDGQYVAFARSGDAPRFSDVLVIPTRGGKPKTVEHLVGDHVWNNNPGKWAPDSRHLVCIESAGLVLLDTQTGSRKVLVRQPEPAGIESLSISPDSRSIAYAVTDTTGADIYVISIHGGRSRKITADHNSFDPLWGPHGVAFNRGGFVHGDIFITDRTGRHPRQLTHTHAGIYPAFWSADGRRMLAADPAMHNGRLWAVNATTGSARDLTGWRGDLFPQGLSRDGTTVLAAVGCGGTASAFGFVETIPFTGGKPRVIVRGPCRGSWNL